MTKRRLQNAFCPSVQNLEKSFFQKNAMRPMKLIRGMCCSRRCTWWAPPITVFFKGQNWSKLAKIGQYMPAEFCHHHFVIGAGGGGGRLRVGGQPPHTISILMCRPGGKQGEGTHGARAGR